MCCAACRRHIRRQYAAGSHHETSPPPALSLRNFHTGWVLGPLTSTLSMIGNLDNVSGRATSWWRVSQRTLLQEGLLQEGPLAGSKAVGVSTAAKSRRRRRGRTWHPCPRRTRRSGRSSPAPGRPVVRGGQRSRHLSRSNRNSCREDSSIPMHTGPAGTDSVYFLGASSRLPTPVDLSTRLGRAPQAN